MYSAIPVLRSIGLHVLPGIFLVILAALLLGWWEVRRLTGTGKTGVEPVTARHCRGTRSHIVRANRRSVHRCRLISSLRKGMTYRIVKLGTTGIETTALGFGSANLFRLPSAGQHAEVLRAASTTLAYATSTLRPCTAWGWPSPKSAASLVAVVTPSPSLPSSASPTRLARCLGRGQRPARRILEARPALRNQAQEKAAGPQSGPAGALLYSAEGYQPAAARKSLERSLRALGTEYVDLLLLHDPAPGSVCSEDVRCCLEDARTTGLIRSWGLAGEVKPCLQIAADFTAGLPVLQVRDDIWLRSPRRVPVGVDGLITFGILGRTLTQLLRYLAANPGRTHQVDRADRAGLRPS